MSTLNRRRAAATVAAAAALALAAGCSTGGGKPNVGVNGLSKRSVASGPVEVSVTPASIDASGARFTVELDNHAVDLNGDYAAGSTLTVDGKPWPDARWSGDGPGGHHRSGTLTFTSAGKATGAVQLHIIGLPKPVDVQWTMTGPVA